MKTINLPFLPVDCLTADRQQGRLVAAKVVSHKERIN